jgi:hypothetical protein
MPDEMTPDTRVCPQCGEPAGAQPFCAACGLNLSREARLPSRSEWEAQQRDPSATEHASNAPDRETPAPDRPGRVAAWLGTHRLAAGLAGVALLLAIILPLTLSGGASNRTSYVQSYMENQLGHNVVCVKEGETNYECQDAYITNPEEVDPNGTSYSVTLNPDGSVSDYRNNGTSLLNGRVPTPKPRTTAQPTNPASLVAGYQTCLQLFKAQKEYVGIAVASTAGSTAAQATNADAARSKSDLEECIRGIQGNPNWQVYCRISEGSAADGKWICGEGEAGPRHITTRNGYIAAME